MFLSPYLLWPVIPHSLLDGAGVGAGGALVTGGPVGPRLGALAFAADTGAAATAQPAHAGLAGVCARGAVAVLPRPVRVTLTGAT